MFKKRAQGLSITTVIVAVIALIVIVVVVAIFTGRLGIFSSGLESIGDPTKTCLANRGTPKPTCDADEYSIVSSDATAQGKKCCKAQNPSTKPSSQKVIETSAGTDDLDNA